ncbi:hypothetical protein LWP59_21615 [Amycolatopsis acidiphila]|uniref:Alpha/beta hydrolase n=1 Tax=Amycolatopsis acidiphila TaxID=715473 RepID=A0A558A5B9_9PSEU|nr:hypothetical protein [Amycolatopsis acidiphila]TVT19418.1 hypothetical protein FNH06_24355 [Amycolatopsis acidiphila]UIJ56771.1 hypothetical protein LWP59_21615 [Amycolatopsis acidiphila]GHG55216.1 hypothetical protein GCM10017788_05590 [Amycolatopsis acidiphila]
MSYSPDPVRAEGPAVVTEGTPDGPIVLVLDPGGEAKHEGLPATWREQLDSWLVVWCRVPAEGGLTAADELLADPPGNGKTVHILSSGPSTDEALRLAEAHTESVRSVLLVDPGATGFVAAGDGEDVAQQWERETEQRRWALTRSGIDVRVIAHSSGGERDRIPAPLPLGHPDVVTAVKKAIAEFS